jgi:hypothetical protein
LLSKVGSGREEVVYSFSLARRSVGKMDTAFGIGPFINSPLRESIRTGKEEKPAQNDRGHEHFHSDVSFPRSVAPYGDINNGTSATAYGIKSV